MAMRSTTAERRRRLGVLSGTGLALIAGLLIVANLLGDRLFFRWDLTHRGRYSLSPATRRLLRSLEDPVTFRLYLTPGLPQPYGTQGRYIRELLNEFRSAGRGKVVLDLRSPDNSDQTLMETRRLQVYPGRFTQVASDQFQVREGYMGLVIFHQDRQDALPFIQDPSNLEYEITSRLRVLTQTSKKTLHFVSNHDEVSPRFIREGPAGRLFDEFNVLSPALSTAAVAEKPDAIFLLGPQRQLTPEEVRALDDALAAGIPVVVALNRRVIYPQNFRSMAQVTGLEDWLAHYGVNLSREFVMDDRCQNIAMRSGGAAFFVKYWPFVMANDLDRAHPATRDLDALGFPYAHPVTFNFAGPSTVRGTVLARSSAQSWVWNGLYNVDPPSLFTQFKAEPPAGFARAGKADQIGPFPLAVVVEGSTTTFRAPAAPVGRLKLVVIGTSFFANPQAPAPPGNALFILNLAHWLTQEGEFLSIPPKGSVFRPLRSLPGAARFAAKLAGHFLPPLLVVAAGLLHWRHRRTLRARVKREYGEARS